MPVRVIILLTVMNQNILFQLHLLFHVMSMMDQYFNALMGGSALTYLKNVMVFTTAET